MALLIIDRELCIGCEACVDACAFDAIHLDQEDIAAANDNCTACGACIDECPTEALSLPAAEAPIIVTPDLDAYEGVWFWVEQFEGQAGSISWEMA
ncbi:MAG: ATP-binding protein, partial [Anaerolineae bacterium]